MVPLSKPGGKATSQFRRDRATFLASPHDKALYKRRASSIEPFFATIKDFFHLDPLPVRGEIAVSAFILLALYAWNLLVFYLAPHPTPQQRSALLENVELEPIPLRCQVDKINGRIASIDEKHLLIKIIWTGAVCLSSEEG